MLRDGTIGSTTEHAADSLPPSTYWSQCCIETLDALCRYQRGQYRNLQGRIFELWQKYTDREMSTSKLLRSCGKVYAPLLSCHVVLTV